LTPVRRAHEPSVGISGALKPCPAPGPGGLLRDEGLVVIVPGYGVFVRGDA